MFDLVGHAVAVANAHPDALAAADSITTDVEADGFSDALTGIGIIRPLRTASGPEQSVTPGALQADSASQTRQPYPRASARPP
jgi:hypothetical protein